MNIAKAFAHAVNLCFLLLLRPDRFHEKEARDIGRRNAEEQKRRTEDPEFDALSEATKEAEQRHLVVRRAFGYSFLVVLAAGLLGGVLGLLAGRFLGCAGAMTTVLLQVAGAGILLWGTLFVRGWEIQTMDGNTFTELGNLWI